MIDEFILLQFMQSRGGATDDILNATKHYEIQIFIRWSCNSFIYGPNTPNPWMRWGKAHLQRVNKANGIDERIKKCKCEIPQRQTLIPSNSQITQIIDRS